jgi:HAD superfamily hydrolase (TIGR01509 family)
MIKAVIFDFDGVIADTEPLLCRAEAIMLSRRGKRITQKYRQEVLGTTTDQTVRIFKKFFALKEPISLLKKERTQTCWALYRREGISPVPGAPGLIRQLKGKYKLAIATSARRDWPVNFLKKSRLINIFKTIVTVEDIKRHKPYPDVYLRAAQKLKVNPEDCLAIEDTRLGVLAAKKAGMKCIVLKQSYARRKDLTKADKIVNNLSNINNKLIKSL